MPTEYDARRPRIPVQLGEWIDEERGLVPFNAWVVDILTKAVGRSEALAKATAEQPYRDAAADNAAMDRAAERERIKRTVTPRPKGKA